MHHRKNLLAIALVVVLTTLIPSGIQPQASGGSTDHDVTISEGGNVRIVTIDEDGNEHEQVYGWLDGSRAFLGVRLEHQHGDGGGARVEGVIDGTPAAEAGLRDGDVIIGIDGRDIGNTADLTRRIHEFEPGDRVDLEITRDGRARTLSVELGEREEPGRSFDFGGLEQFGEQMGRLGERLGRAFAFEFAGDEDFDNEELQERMRELHERLGQGFAFEFDGDEGFDSEEFQERMRELHERLGEMKLDIQIPDPGERNLSFGTRRPKLGVQLVATTPELREHLGGSEDAGVLVSKVLAGMPAEAAGVRVGDLIVAVGDEAVNSTRDLVEALSDRAGESIELEVIRDGRSLCLDVDLEDEPAGDRA